MSVLKGDQIGDVRNVSNEEIEIGKQRLIQAFLQGAVYAWCNCNGTKPFCFATFAGSNNYYWQNTELAPLYDSQKAKGKGKPESMAARNGGALLKQVLVKDKRTFKTWKEAGHRYTVRMYAWTGEENND